MIKACYRCGISFEEADKSFEHIIPNSIGGKLGTYNLLCRDCNNFYGSHFDSEISRQIGFQAHILNVKTDRPLPDKLIGYTQSGQKFGFAPGLKNLDKVTLNIKGKKVDSFIRSNEVEKFIGKKNKEMAKKGKKTTYTPYTQLPGDTVFFKNNLSREIGDVGFGGNLYHKAISRIAINFFLLKSDNIHFVKKIIEELEDKSVVPRSRFYYSDTNLLIDLKENEISHTIVLKGDPTKKILYAYINLFSCHSHLINLNTEYDGPKLDHIYSYDCINGNEINKDEWLYITRPELVDYHLIDHEKRHHFSTALHKKALDNFSRIAEEQQTKNE